MYDLSPFLIEYINLLIADAVAHHHDRRPAKGGRPADGAHAHALLIEAARGNGYDVIINLAASQLGCEPDELWPVIVERYERELFLARRQVDRQAA